jgi:uncharacterized protein (DUF1684 family)
MRNWIFILFIAAVCKAQDTLPSIRPKYDRLAVENFQKALNAEFASVKESPLEASDRKDFTSLDFFPPGEKYFVIAELVRTESEKPFEMKTSTSRLPLYVKYGEIHFNLGGKPQKLNVYQSVELMKKRGYEDHLFLPFSDATNGKETYIGGRYIDLRIPRGNTIAVDFNQAYNPYCAYNHKYSCPAVPQENVLDIAVYAGVKKFRD